MVRTKNTTSRVGRTARRRKTTKKRSPSPASSESSWCSSRSSSQSSSDGSRNSRSDLVPPRQSSMMQLARAIRLQGKAIVNILKSQAKAKAKARQHQGKSHPADNTSPLKPAVLIITDRDSSFPQRSKRQRTPVVSCGGCKDFVCCRSWKRKSDGPQTRDEKILWMKNHEIIVAGRCPHHPESSGTPAYDRDGNLKSFRQCRELRGGKLCQAHIPWAAVFLPASAKVDVEEHFNFLVSVAKQARGHAIGYDLDVNKNTVTAMYKRLLAWAHGFNQSRVKRFQKLAVDETFFGKRKYHRGKKVRMHGWWFITATEILRDGSMGETCWELVQRRDEKTCSSFASDSRQFYRISTKKKSKRPVSKLSSQSQRCPLSAPNPSPKCVCSCR